MQRRSRALNALQLFAVALCAMTLATCGSTGDPDGSPASIVPEGAPLYFEVTVRPEGDLRADAEAAARTILGKDDPAGELRRLIDQWLAQYGDSFGEDIEPWLGNRVGLFVPSLSGEAERFAYIAATEDSGQAVDSILAAREADEPAELSDRSHNGVDYFLDEDENVALAEIGDFVVLADEQTLRQVIDAQESGRTLEADEGFAATQDVVAQERLGLGWIDFAAIVDGLAQAPSFPPEQAATLRQLVALEGLEGVAFALTADQAAVRLDSATLSGDQPQRAGDPEVASQALRAVPADALLGVGLGDVGGQFQQRIDRLGRLSGFGGGRDPAQLLDQIERATRLDLEEDVLTWMEQGSLFVQGTSLADVGGALIVRTSDRQASLEAVEQLRSLLEQGGRAEVEKVDSGGVEGLRLDGQRLPVFLVVAGDRFIVAAGQPALDAALEPRGALGDDEAFGQAAGALGEGIQPTLYASVPGLLQLARVPLGEDPQAQQVNRYLEAFTALAAGSAREGEITRGRLALGLEQR